LPEITVSLLALRQLTAFCGQRAIRQSVVNSGETGNSQGGVSCPDPCPPRSTKLTEPLSVDPVLVVPLDQLWTRLLPDRWQEVLQRFTQMIVHRLTPPATHGEADDE
jgi:hypothetical protein